MVQALWKKSQFLQKLNLQPLYDPETALLATDSQRRKTTKTYNHAKTRTRVKKRPQKLHNV